MKKWIFLACTLFWLSFSVVGQKVNRLEFSERTNNMILIGPCNHDAFAMQEFQEWFDKNYENYEPKPAIIKTLKTLPLTGISLKIVMGTWCSDSRREVPRFYRIMDEIGFPADQVNLLMVDCDKKIPGMDIEDLRIERVPTLIFYRTYGEGKPKEIGRIIETPIHSLEKDMLDILQKSR